MSDDYCYNTRMFKDVKGPLDNIIKSTKYILTNLNNELFKKKVLHFSRNFKNVNILL